MATIQQSRNSPSAKGHVRQEILEALERGEHVRLMAEVDSGQLDQTDFETALEELNRQHWLRRFVSVLLGR